MVPDFLFYPQIFRVRFPRAVDVQLVDNLNIALLQLKKEEKTKNAPSNDTENLRIEFAKMNRNISIRELKEVMWQSFLKDLPSIDEKGMSSEIDLEGEAPSNAFSQIYAALETLMDRIKHKKISMQSCFLTILHLANEKGLTLKNQKDDFLIYN